MIKPPPSGAIPGVTDTLDFVKNLWGSMNIPGTGMPGMPNMAGAGLSTEDLDKRIADMKAVEAWLNLNLTMLRGTIQGMEVQRSTLATLKTMGASMAEMMRQSGVSAENMANTPFASFFGQPAQGAAASGSTSSSAAGKAGAAAGGGSAQPGAAGAGAAQPGATAALPGADAAMAWWNMLQDQFTQAVTTAMAPAPGAASTPGAASAPAAKAAGSPEGGGGGEKAAAPQAQPSSTPQPDAGNAAPENGGGKGRAGKSKADKA
jgi:hypothetical protein